MSRQNAYDDDEFFDSYQQLRESGTSLNDRLERPAMDSLLPPLTGLVVLDVGAGSGGNAVRYADAGSAVVGIEPSARMLAAAPPHDRVEYRHGFIEDVELDASSFDVITASMALHYVADLDDVVEKLAMALVPGGVLVASFEHPIVSCGAVHEWCGDDEHWPVDDYSSEGPRHTTWFGRPVTKHHRTMASLVGALLGAGLRVTALVEPTARASDIEAQPNLAQINRRPAIVVLRGEK